MQYVVVIIMDGQQRASRRGSIREDTSHRRRTVLSIGEQVVFPSRVLGVGDGLSLQEARTSFGLGRRPLVTIAKICRLVGMVSR